MNRIIAILAVLLISQSLFGQTLTKFGTVIVTETGEFKKADSARVEPLIDSVAVFLTNPRQGSFLGLEIEVQSTSKAVSIIALKDGDFYPIDQLKSKPFLWLLSGQPGKYNLLIIESSPDGLQVTPVATKITGPTEPPPPLPGDWTAVSQTAKELADKLDDPKTKDLLARTYATTAQAIIGKSYEECVALTTVSRRIAMSARRDMYTNTEWLSYRDKSWNSWFVAVDREFIKVVERDAVKYAEGLNAIHKALK